MLSERSRIGFEQFDECRPFESFEFVRPED